MIKPIQYIQNRIEIQNGRSLIQSLTNSMCLVLLSLVMFYLFFLKMTCLKINFRMKFYEVDKIIRGKIHEFVG